MNQTLILLFILLSLNSYCQTDYEDSSISVCDTVYSVEDVDLGTLNPGGDTKIIKYLIDNIKSQFGTQAFKSFIVEYTITFEGKIIDINLGGANQDSLNNNEELNYEALDFTPIESSPTCTPAKRNGIPICVSYYSTFKFK